MTRILIVLALAMLATATPAAVVLNSGLPERGWLKVSHGYVIQFNRAQRTRAACALEFTRTQNIRGSDSIEAFDREGQRVLGFDVLEKLPGATEVSLSDVVMRAGGPIVVGATVKKTHGGTEAQLMYFNWDGSLIRSVNYPEDINALDLDEAGNVWSLADYHGRAEGTSGPLIYVHDPEGRLVKTLLRRTDYPAGFEAGARMGGVVGFGVTEQGVWFWQPIRHRLTIVSRQGVVLRQTSIRFPKSGLDEARVHPTEAHMVEILPGGEVVAGIHSPWSDVPTGAYLSNGRRFIRSSSPQMWLIGVDGPDFVFLDQRRSERGVMEVVRDPIPQSLPRR